MQLVRLELRDYLAYRTAVVDMPTSGLSLIVGPNNAGKSALLSAIDALVQISAPASLSHAGTARAELVARYELSDDERRVWISSPGQSDRTSAWLESEALRFVEWEVAQAPDNRLYGLVLRASDAHGSLHPIVDKEDGNLTSNQFRHAAFPAWIVGHDPSEPYQITNGFSGPNADPLLSGGIPGFEFIATWLAEWRANTYHFGPLRTGTQRTRAINATRILAPSGDNLPEVLHWFRNNEEDVFALIARTIANLVPQVGQLRTVVEGSQLEVAFSDQPGGVRNLKDLGTGVEQLLMTCVVGITQRAASLMLLEEPETALHPEAQRWLLSYLEEWSENRQFVITTHSGIFLDRAPEGGAPVWLVERDSGVSTVRSATDVPAEVLRALGVRLSDVLSARGLILVEGRSDRDVLLRWFGELLQQARIVVVDSGGGDAAWDVEQLVRWVESANKLQQPCIFFRDRDEMDERSIRSVAALGRVKVLGRRELENYLLAPKAIREVIARLLGPGQSGPDETAVTERIDQTAERLKPVVLLKRVAFQVGRHRPISRADVVRLARDPTLDRLKDTVTRNGEPLGDIDGIWAVERERLDRQWKRGRLAIAPGAEILSAVWALAGLHFDKSRDCSAIAELIDPPAELTASVRAFVERVEAA